MLKSQQILSVIAGYLGEPPALSVKKTTQWRVAPDCKGGWHQDGAFWGRESERSVSGWR